MQKQGNTQIGSWQWDIQDNELILDDEAAHLLFLECTDNTCTIEEYFECIPADERNQIKKELEQNRKNGAKSYHIEHGLKHSGVNYTVVNKGKIIRTYNKEAILFAGILTKVSPKNDYPVLKSDKVLFKKLVENSLMGIYIYQDGKFPYINPTVSKLLGYPQKTIMNQLSLEDLIYPDDLSMVRENIQKRLQGEADTLKYEFRALHQSGRIINVMVSSSVVEYNEKPALIGSFVDITEHKKRERYLEESTAKYKVLAEQDIYGLYILLEDKIAFINYKAADILGYLPEELEDKSILDLNLFVDDEGFKNRLKLRKKDIQRSFDFETKVYKKNGDIIDIHVNSGRITYKGKPAVLGVVEDITTQKSNREQLIASEARYRALLNSLPDMFAYLDKDGTYLQLHVPQSFNSVVDPSTCIGKTVYDVVPSETAGLIHDAVKTSLENQTKVTINYTIPDKNDLKYREARISPVDDNTAIAVIQDFTKRKKAEMELYQNEKRLRLLLEQLPALLWTTDKDLMFTSSMGSGLEILGLKSGEVVGNTLYDYFKTDDDNFKPIAKHKQALEGQSVQYQQTWKNHTFQTAIDPLTDLEGNLIGTVALAFDITEIQDAKEKLQQSIKEKDILLAEIHHRVKNNLSLITSIFELQIARHDDPKLNEVLTDSKNRVLAIAAIHEILYTAQNFSSASFDKYIEILSRVFTSQNPSIEIQSSLEPVKLKITQAIPCGLIFNELLSNAIKHAVPQSTSNQIHTKLSQEGRTVKLSVRDYGKGLKNQKSWDSYNTLGFTLAKRLIQQLEGDLQYTFDNGSVFEIRFQVETG